MNANMPALVTIHINIGAGKIQKRKGKKYWQITENALFTINYIVMYNIHIFIYIGR